MDFLKELFNINELIPFLSKVMGDNYALIDFGILVLGVFIIQKIVYGRAGFFLFFVMTLFTALFHYNSDHTLIQAVEYIYSVKGIGYFRQEIFLGLFILILAFISGKMDKESNDDTGSFFIPTFVMIETLNIIGGLEGTKITSQPMAFWFVLIILLIIFGSFAEANKDRKIEEKILNGTADSADSAYWYKRKKEKEEEDDYYMQQQYYNK